MRKDPRARKSCANFAVTWSYWAGQKLRASLQRHSGELYINPFLCTVCDWVVMSCIYRVVLTCILIKSSFLQVKVFQTVYADLPQSISWLNTFKTSEALILKLWQSFCERINFRLYRLGYMCLCIYVCLWDIQPNFGEFPWLNVASLQQQILQCRWVYPAFW